MPGDCIVPGCTRQAAQRKGGLCELHAWRRQHGIPDEQPVQDRLPPFARVVESCIQLSDVDSEDDAAWHLAIERVKTSLQRWWSKELAPPAVVAADPREEADKEVGR